MKKRNIEEIFIARKKWSSLFDAWIQWSVVQAYAIVCVQFIVFHRVSANDLYAIDVDYLGAIAKKKLILTFIPANFCRHCHFSLDSLHLHPMHLLIRIEAHRFRSAGMIFCPSWCSTCTGIYLSPSFRPTNNQKNGIKSWHITKKNCFWKNRLFSELDQRNTS